MFSRETDISVATSTLAKIAIFALAIFFFWTIRDILILLLISITLASALEPMVDALARNKVPRAVSVISVYILALGFLILLGYLITPAVLDQFKQLGNTNALAAQFNNKTGFGFLNSFNWTDIVTKNVQAITSQFNAASGDFFKRTLGVFGGVVEIITIMVVSFYLLAEKNGMKQFIYAFVPQGEQQKAVHLANKIQKRVGWWLIGQLIASAIIFAIVLIALTLLKVKYALVIAILSGFFELVPYIGPIISGIVAVFFALLQGPTLAIFVAILYVLLSKFEGYILVPKIMQRTIGVSPLVILVAILIGFKLAGIFGILLAVPVVAMVTVVIQEWGTLVKPSRQD